MRAGVEYLPPLWFASTRVLIGALVLMLVLAVQKNLKLPSKADLPAIFSVGICMMGLYVSPGAHCNGVYTGREGRPVGLFNATFCHTVRHNFSG